MSHHLTYLEAVVTGLVQGVTELFPISSLGHNVLLPALVGGNWATTLSVTDPNSPYLAFVVGLHVATAIAMIVYFRRDWLRIISGFLSSARKRSVTTPDERLAWMIIVATIPVGLVGVAFQKEITKVFAKAELAAVFLAVNGVILLLSERMRRSRERVADGAGTAVPVAAAGPALGAPGGPGRAGAPGMPGGGWPAGGRGPGPEGYSQQPWQQQWQGPDPRYGQNGDGQYHGNGGYSGNGQHGRDDEHRRQYGQPQYGQPQYGQPQYGQPQYGQPQYGQPQYGQPQYGREPQGWQPGPGWQPAADPRGGYDPRDPRGVRDQRQAGRHGHAAGRAGGHAAGRAAGRPAVAGGHAAEDPAVVADRRLSAMGYKQAVIVGSSQILALLAGISRDGIVTVAGMWRGLSRQDAARFSFLLSAPIILAAGALKAKDLFGPLSKGMHGPILVGSIISGICAYLSLRFLMKYFSEDKSLNPFGIYCLIAGLGSLAFLALK